MTRFKQDRATQKVLATTVKLADIRSEDFDTIFYVGEHGPMWDLVDNPASIALLESLYSSGKPGAAVLLSVSKRDHPGPPCPRRHCHGGFAAWQTPIPPAFIAAHEDVAPRPDVLEGAITCLVKPSVPEIARPLRASIRLDPINLDFRAHLTPAQIEQPRASSARQYPTSLGRLVIGPPPGTTPMPISNCGSPARLRAGEAKIAHQHEFTFRTRGMPPDRGNYHDRCTVLTART
jgi:hypothetical protein